MAKKKERPAGRVIGDADAAAKRAAEAKRKRRRERNLALRPKK